MTPELQKYYEARFDMFASEGWTDLMMDIEKMLSSTNTLESVSDEKTLHFRRGEVSMMRWMLSLKPISELAYADLKEKEEDEDTA